MAEKDQVRPLAPATNRISSDEEEMGILQSKNLHQRRCIKCFGCCMAGILIQAVVIIVLVFTMFHVKDPEIKVNGINIIPFKLINGIPDPKTNITLTADVSVKNPNVATFKYCNSTTTVYYRGHMVGEAHTPPGRAKPRRTQRMNITVQIMITAELLHEPKLKSDIESRLLPMSSCTQLGGRVKILKIFKKDVIVQMNCTMTVNLTNQSIQEQECKRKVTL